MSLVALVPVAHRAVANAALADLGFGPANFSVPLRDGDAGDTHAGLPTRL